MIDTQAETNALRQAMRTFDLLTQIKSASPRAKNIKNEGWSQYIYENKGIEK